MTFLPRDLPELVFIDDGYGFRVVRDLTRSKIGVSDCAHCGASTIWVFTAHDATFGYSDPLCSVLCYTRRARFLHGAR